MSEAKKGIARHPPPLPARLGKGAGMSKKACQICEMKTDQRYGTTVGKWACAKCVKELEQVYSIHSSSLPALPESLYPPFTASGYVVGDKLGVVATASEKTEATFLAALLNAVYPAKSP